MMNFTSSCQQNPLLHTENHDYENNVLESKKEDNYRFKHEKTSYMRLIIMTSIFQSNATLL